MKVDSEVACETFMAPVTLLFKASTCRIHHFTNLVTVIEILQSQRCTYSVKARRGFGVSEPDLNVAE